MTFKTIYVASCLMVLTTFGQTNIWDSTNTIKHATQPWVTTQINTTRTNLQSQISLATGRIESAEGAIIVVAGDVEAAQGDADQALEDLGILSGRVTDTENALGYRPTYVEATGIVVNALLPYTTYPVVTDIVDNAISLIPTADPTKIINLSEGLFLSISGTNIVLYVVTNEISIDAANMLMTVAVGGLFTPEYTWPTGEYLMPLMIADEFYLTYDGGTWAADTVLSMPMNSVILQSTYDWYTMDSEYPVTLSTAWEGCGGTATIDYHVITTVTTNALKTFASTDDLANIDLTPYLTAVESTNLIQALTVNYITAVTGTNISDYAITTLKGTSNLWSTYQTFSTNVYIGGKLALGRNYEASYGLSVNGIYNNGVSFNTDYVRANTYFTAGGQYILSATYGLYLASQLYGSISWGATNIGGARSLVLGSGTAGYTGGAIELRIDGVLKGMISNNCFFFGPIINGKQAFEFNDGTNKFWTNVNSVTNQLTSN